MSDIKRSKLTGKGSLIGLVVLAGAAALLASVQAWLSIALLPGVATVEELTVTGQQITPALTLIALAALAAALVLTIAGKGFRRVIAVLIVALGGGLAYSGVQAIVNPLDGASGALEGVSGIAGDAQASLVSSLTVSAWPAVTVAVGVVLALAGVLVLLFGSAWKQGGRKYESSTESKRARAAGTATGDRISDWEALSDGDDPTDGDDDFVDGDDAIDDAIDGGGDEGLGSGPRQ